MDSLVKILVVDDEPVIGRILKTELEPAGFRVWAVQSGAEALKLMDIHTFGAALVDINMPQMDGFSLLREICSRQPHMIVFMITANGSIESAVQAMKMGAQDYITKPFDCEQIIVKLRQIFSSQHRYSAKVQRPSTREKASHGSSPEILEIYKQADKVKNMKSTVLICGESGTGKGVLAKYLHTTSIRKDAPFIHVDCAAIPAHLMESELFGHEKGAFTGASSVHYGKFEQAKNGTIFLDEINSLPKQLQSKLLIALQERSFYRVGGNALVYSEARIITASNDNLEGLVASGQFREDLFYRLNTVQLRLPPLRRRKGDIPLLAQSFLEEFAEVNGVPMLSLAPETIECLLNYEWPGNIRELENAVESAAILSEGSVIEVKDLPLRIQEHARAQAREAQDNTFSLNTQEMLAIIAALEKCGGHREKTAQMLGISRRTLQYKLNKFGLLGKNDQ